MGPSLPTGRPAAVESTMPLALASSVDMRVAFGSFTPFSTHLISLMPEPFAMGFSRMGMAASAAKPTAKPTQVRYTAPADAVSCGVTSAFTLSNLNDTSFSDDHWMATATNAVATPTTKVSTHLARLTLSVDVRVTSSMVTICASLLYGSKSKLSSSFGTLPVGSSTSRSPSALYVFVSYASGAAAPSPDEPRAGRPVTLLRLLATTLGLTSPSKEPGERMEEKCSDGASSGARSDVGTRGSRSPSLPLPAPPLPPSRPPDMRGRGMPSVVP
mmetsp:Transcript_26873/g.93298  ORF Transcript_26873/g.93298 Transcript_26873/m.93298 type:complete len:272 (+) Transcript_26873:497-1312(+)